jgi:hypothetical protein
MVRLASEQRGVRFYLVTFLIFVVVVLGAVIIAIIAKY